MSLQVVESWLQKNIDQDQIGDQCSHLKGFDPKTPMNSDELSNWDRDRVVRYSCGSASFGPVVCQTSEQNEMDAMPGGTHAG